MIGNLYLVYQIRRFDNCEKLHSNPSEISVVFLEENSCNSTMDFILVGPVELWIDQDTITKGFLHYSYRALN